MQTLHWLTREEDIRAASKYEPIIQKSHRWFNSAAPKKKHGSFDRDKALTSDDLSGQVNEKLFPCRTPVLVHLSGPRPFVHPPFERLRL
jgi:hypothetical protein